ncbi:MAG: hypothetical protein Kow00109_11970 [Acidobacteriota bacterium]
MPVAYRLEGPWAGPPPPGDATLDLGEYRFDVLLWPSGTPWFSGGFSTLFSEWQTTAEARETQWRCFEGSLRFPVPPQQFRVQISKRSGAGPFRLLASLPAQTPDGPGVVRAAVAASSVANLRVTGPAPERYDLLFVAEGYTAEEKDRFREDAEHFQHALLKVEPYAGARDRLNIRALFVPSPESGIPDPRRGYWPRTALGLHYNSLGLDRYAVVTEEHRLRETIAGAPYDLPVILLNSEKYGGGGVYGQWAVVAARAEFADYIFLHELGHALAGLGDEYFTSEVPYLPDPAAPEPWQPNLSRVRELSFLKWRAFVTPGTPIPTPWGKERYLALQAQARGEAGAGPGWRRRAAAFSAANPTSAGSACSRAATTRRRECSVLPWTASCLIVPAGASARYAPRRSGGSWTSTPLPERPGTIPNGTVEADRPEGSGLPVPG